MLSRNFHAVEAYRPAMDESAPSEVDRGVEGEEAGRAVVTSITQGNLEDIGRLRMLSADEERDFARRMRQGENAARGALITHNLKLVVHIARRNLGRGLSLLDLVEEGSLGLMHALEKFDPDRGFRLSISAIWWIRQAIEMALMAPSRMLRQPVHAKAGKVCSQTPGSLEQLAGSADAATETNVPATAHPYQIGLERQASEWLAKLSDRHRWVIERRFGLNGHDMATIEELARAFKVSRGQIQKILAEAQGDLASDLGNQKGNQGIFLS